MGPGPRAAGAEHRGPRQRGSRGGVLPRRPACRLRWHGRRGAGVGPGDGQAGPVLRGSRAPRHLGGRLARRPLRGVGQCRGQDRAALATIRPTAREAVTREGWPVETSVSLLERLSGRPTDADWRRLHDLYAPLLRAWAARAGVAEADADDLSQEVLLAVVRDVTKFEHRGPGAFRAWLRGILANRARDHFRRRAARPVATGDSALADQLDQLEAPDSPLSRLWDREHDEHVARHLLKVVEGDFAPATWAAFRRQ